MKYLSAFTVALLAVLPAAVYAQLPPAPTIASISPNQTIAGSSPFVLTVKGSNYAPGINAPPGSIVRWSGVAIPTTYISASELWASVDAQLVIKPETATISVLNPDGQTSNTASFTIVAPLTITTLSPLRSAIVGASYSTTLTASGGAPPYSNWRVVEGVLPPGFTLDSYTGVLGGTPTGTGSYTFQVYVNDSAAQTASMVFSLTVRVAPLVITTASPLPGGTAGVAYSQPMAATGGLAPYSWSSTPASPAPGLTLSPAGVLGGTPTQVGTYNFTVSAADSAKASTTKPFTLVVNPAPLVITTASPLPGGTAGVAYSQPMAATGGAAPYSWSVTAGSLAPGLALSPAGVLGGTPTQAGTYNFTVSAADSAGASTTKPFTLIVNVPPAPTLSITGLSDSVNPKQQPPFGVKLESSYTLDISGRVTLTFTPDAVNPADDPAIQFSTGGRTADFTIPAGQMIAVFQTPAAALQTGTVAGRIELSVTFSAAGQDITPSPPPTRLVQVPRSAPDITSVRVVKSGSGFDVQVVGLSTPRQVMRATFRFTPASQGNLQTTELTVDVDSMFTTWYKSEASGQFGSTFLYTQPFQVQGNLGAIASVAVTLTNAEGSSQPVSASF